MPVVRHRFTSRVLAGNPLGDPVERELCVYVPPDYDAHERYPALLAIAGFTGTGASYFNTDHLIESLDRRLDRLIAAGACPPLIVAAPDCFTRVGGNQYINSAGTGRYEDYCVDEIIPFVDANYRTIPRGQWAVFGKSSGGYGRRSGCTWWTPPGPGCRRTAPAPGLETPRPRSRPACRPGTGRRWG